MSEMQNLIDADALRHEAARVSSQCGAHNFSYRCLFLDESLNCVATHCFRQNDTADSVDPMHSAPAMLVFLMPASALLLLSLRSRRPYHFSV
jgi:hypothetical protein